MDKEQRIRELTSDMDYGCTKQDLYPDDAKEIAKALDTLGYRKIVWHKVAYHWDLPETRGQYLCIVTNRDKYFILSYDGSAGYSSWRNRDTGDYVNPCFITAWAELSEYEE